VAGWRHLWCSRPPLQPGIHRATVTHVSELFMEA
jgi:hypothetical protein